MVKPMVRNPVEDLTKKGLNEPAKRATAFEAACPVDRISVVMVSAVLTQVEQLPPMKNMRARNDVVITTARDDPLSVAKQNSTIEIPPPI